MAEIDGARMRAKYKLKLLFMLFVFVVLAGVFLEYQRFTQPLDEVAVIYVNGEAASVVEMHKALAEEVVEKPKVEENKPEEFKEPLQQPVKENETPKENAPVVNADALPGFLDELKAAQELVGQVQYSEPVLNKIIQQEPKAEPQNAEPKIFQDGKIEVYDSNKGVVAVQEEPKPEAPKVEEKPAEVKPEPAKAEEKPIEQPEAPKADAKPQEEAAVIVEEKVSSAVNEVAAAVETAKEEENLLKEEIDAVIENEKKAAEKAEDSVRERVNQDLGKVEEAGEEAPIVLIPGLVQQDVPVEYEP